MNKANQYTALKLSLKNNNEIERILNEGFDINVPDKGDSRTLLHYASIINRDVIDKKGDLPLCKFLLKKGANPNVRDNLGFTPLHYAVQNHLLTIAQILMENGADPNIPDNYGNNSLLRCDFDGNDDDMIKILLQNGADPNFINNFKVSPVGLAIDMGNSKTIQIVLNYKKYNAPENLNKKSNQTTMET